MTIADQLTLLSSTKTAIRDAIEAKGVAVGAIPFADYPGKIAQISSGGGGGDTQWQRPSDWLTLPTLTSADNKFVGLHAVYEDANFVALTAAGNYTVDWGDGVIENYAANVVAQHEYDYSTYDTAGATLCSRGYKQAIITVTPQSGKQFTLININKRHSTLTSNSVSSGFLEVSIAGSDVTGVCIGNSSVGGTASNIVHALLESASVICPSLTNCTAIFQNCCSLRHIPQLDTSAVTNMSRMFYNCYSLQSIPQLDTSAVTNMSSMFSGCYSLQSIPQLVTSAVTDMSFMFSSCSSLQSIPQLVTSAVTNMSRMLNGCYSLQSIPQLDTSAVTNMSYMFYGCYSLQSIPQLVTSAVTDMSFMFSSCSSLQSIPQLVTSAVTNMSRMLNGCYSLQSIPQLDTSAVTNMSYMFYGCYSLQSIPQLDTSAVTNMSRMFSGCYSLQSIPQLVTSAVTDMSYMFSYCSSLQSIPQLVTSAVTNMSYMLGDCYSLSSMKATGIAQNISVANCKLSATRLNEIYSNLATVTGKTITVTGNYGTASDDPSIATAKGWTVTG